MKNTHCNAGVVKITYKGTLTGYGYVWFKIYSIANILSMENSTNKYPIFYNSITGDKLILKKCNKKSSLTGAHRAYIYTMLGLAKFLW